MGAAAEDLMKRFHNLELSQAKLREQLEVLLRDGTEKEGEKNRRIQGEQKQVIMAGNFVQNPYLSVLQQLGHALYICRPVSGEIIYWNPAAEVLYGWKCSEALNQSVTNLLIDTNYHPYWENIMERVYRGQAWSGLFSFKKRLGASFMAMVTANPLYDNGVCVGVIFVSSDASMLNNAQLERQGLPSNEARSPPREPKLNFRKVHWPPQPQVTSSLSNLAGKVLAKLYSRVNGSQAPEFERNSETNSANVSADVSLGNVPTCCDSDKMKDVVEKHYVKETSFPVSYRSESSSCAHCRINKMESSEILHNGENFLEDPHRKASLLKKKTPPKAEDLRHSKSPPSVETSVSSRTGSSTVDDIEQNLVGDSEIHWEDLVLGEEIGEGSFAVVYHGLWNGSDVAIKVYARMDYRESVLLDYKKEIVIMKKLRHPNVLLFMGAVYSPNHLAIVTEYMPRGSLFRTLHKNKQVLDLRRRLRMALDVVRGMNYLHRRNPPIIHRDLKSSNLLVDKSWTVKVGDFGLSCLKLSTVLSAKTGRGTPQWMAPEVLRGECSSEKSDVFSFGVILWELMTESIPWSHLNSMQVVGVVGFMDRRLDLPDGIDPVVATIISDCWASNPLQRPSFQDLVGRMSGLMETLAPPPPPARRRLEQPLHVSVPDC